MKAVIKYIEPAFIKGRIGRNVELNLENLEKKTIESMRMLRNERNKVNRAHRKAEL